MARRRRSSRGRFKPVNIRFVIFQIIVLLAFLIALFAVQDTISEGTSEILTSLTGEDVEVQQPVGDTEESEFPGGKTDDGAEIGPADDTVERESSTVDKENEDDSDVEAPGAADDIAGDDP